MNNFKVYLHKNKINKKVYIGITRQSTHERWRAGGRGYKSQKKFWNAIQKYGWDNFEHIVLHKNLTELQAIEIETELIIQWDSVQNGYNSRPGGGVTNHSRETLEKMRKSKTGQRHSMETKKKMSESKNYAKRAVICLETNVEYRSLQEAQDDTGTDSSSISRVCYGTQKTAGGYHWYFKGENPIIQKDKRLRPVVCITTGVVYSSIAEAAKDTNSDVSNIKKVCDGKYKTTNKLKWRWNEDV